MDVNLATTTTLRMSPAKMEVQMVVRVTCTGPEDEGAVADTTFRDPKGGIKTTYGACPKPQRVASGTAIVNILHLGPEAFRFASDVVWKGPRCDFGGHPRF